MDFDILPCVTAPDAAEMRPLLQLYYEGVLSKLAAIGGPVLDPADLVQDTLDNLGAGLPPQGAIFLARRAEGPLVGCGFLRRLDATRGEMKRLFVKPESQGAGLGRALSEARIARARAMGLRSLYADTVRGNTAMLRLYAALGFRETGRYPGNGNPAYLDRYLVYRRLDL